MKNAFVLFLACFLLGACNGNKNQDETSSAQTEEITSEETQVDGKYGEEISEEGAVPVDELLAKMESSDSLQIKLSGEILATCKMKGCWMNVEGPGEDKMRVTFKDYGFFVPKEGMEGKTVIMDGYAKKVTTDVETQRHFAKDAGKPQEEIDAITEPKNEITFVASGVIIKEGE